MQKPVNSETDLIKAIWNRTNLNEQAGPIKAGIEAALKAAEKLLGKEALKAGEKAVGKEAAAAAKAAEMEAAAGAKAVEPDLFSGIATPTLTTATGKIYSPKPPKTTTEIMRDAAGLRLTKKGTRVAKQSIPLDPKQRMASDPFDPNASAEPISTINNTPRDLRTAAEIASAVDNSGIKVTVVGDRMSPISYPGTMYKFDPNWKNNLLNLGRSQPLFPKTGEVNYPLAVGPGQGRAVPVIKTQEPINSHNTLATGKEGTSTGSTERFEVPRPTPGDTQWKERGDGGPKIPPPMPKPVPDPVIKGIEGTKMPGSTTPKPNGNLLRTAAEIGVLAAGAAKVLGYPKGTPGIPYVPSQDDNNSRTSGGAGSAGKQYYYPDTFVGREIGTETSASPKKQTVDQQLVSTAKQITDRSGAQKVAAAPPARGVTPVQITEPGIPAGQLNQRHVQRPATNQEDLKRVRWNSASYHQLSPSEKKFVEDNDRAEGFDKMPGGQYHTEHQMESYTPEKQEIVEHYRQVLAQKLMEQEYWGADKVRRAIESGEINPESYRTDRKGMEHMYSALEGGTIASREQRYTQSGGHKKEVTLDHTGKINIPVGQQVFPNNPVAQASLKAIMASMGAIHGSQKSVGGERFHPALEGTVPHDPSTHGALNQLDPSTVAHTEILRKAQQTRTDTSRDASFKYNF